MATQTITSCDITGEICSQIFRLGFADGENEYRLELSQEGVGQLLSEIINVLPPNEMDVLLTKLIGQNWKTMTSHIPK